MPSDGNAVAPHTVPPAPRGAAYTGTSQPSRCTRYPALDGAEPRRGATRTSPASDSSESRVGSWHRSKTDQHPAPKAVAGGRARPHAPVRADEQGEVLAAAGVALVRAHESSLSLSSTPR